jgi:mannose-6-phosphate isomerase-like protein (cupin superfamily)
MTRRDLSMLPLGALLTSAFADAQNEGSEQKVLSHSFAYTFEQLAVKKSANGGVTRPVVTGKLPTGEIVEMHETTLPPGQMPHAAHKHRHEEFMLIREGTVEFMGGGKSQQLGPGGVAYAASGEMHSIKNVGSVPANYFVIAIGSQQDRA